MKKYFVFAAMAFATFMNYSCTEVDNPGSPTTDVYYLDGKDYLANVVGTFQGEVGAEVSLTLGVYDPFDVFAVDFGDGKLVVDTVCYQNGGLKDENGMTVEWRKSATKFTGTVAGEGIVTVYGNSDLWYMNLTGGIAPTSFNQERMKKVNQMLITGANLEEVKLPQMDSLKQFSFNNSPVKSVDVSKAPRLTSLIVNSTTASKYECNLASVNISQNANLESISLQGNQNSYGKIKKLDLTNNKKLTGMGLYVQYNELNELILGENALTAINVQNNKLTSLPWDKLSKLKSLYAADNELASINVSEMASMTWLDVKNNKLTGDLDLTANKKFANVYVNGNELTSVKVDNVTKQFYFDNNKMTIATMPALPAGMNTTSKKKQFHYAPQADMEVTPAGAVVDLSAQAKAKGMEAEEVATTFTVKVGDAALVAGTDYTIADGKITFLKSQNGAVVEMTTAAFPALTLKTKAFDVTVAE